MSLETLEVRAASEGFVPEMLVREVGSDFGFVRLGDEGLSLVYGFEFYQVKAGVHLSVSIPIGDEDNLISYFEKVGKEFARVCVSDYFSFRELEFNTSRKIFVFSGEPIHTDNAKNIYEVKPEIYKRY